MDKRVKDLTGKRYGRLLVVSYSHTKNHKTYWNCLCDCGNTKIVFITRLQQGRTNSCGCIQKEFNKNKRTHGHSLNKKMSPEYRAWSGMKVRCYYKNTKYYKDYGGRGITVCDRWLGENGFINFLADMGLKPTPKHSLDRFPDVNGNYEKSNCRWATDKEQGTNKRGNVWIEYNGVKMVQVDFCILIGSYRTQVLNKIKNGMSINEVAEYYLKRKNERNLAK